MFSNILISIKSDEHIKSAIAFSLMSHSRSDGLEARIISLLETSLELYGNQIMNIKKKIFGSKCGTNEFSPEL